MTAEEKRERDRVYHREWRKRNHEKALEIWRRYRERNREKCNKWSLDAYHRTTKKNPEAMKKRNEATKKWRAENREKWNAYLREYRKRNKGK